MKLVDMVCPNCGAKIQADADMGSAKCEHCGSTFLLDDEAVHVCLLYTSPSPRDS